MLAVLVLGMAMAVWQVPRFMDWGRYRGAIAAIASARLGRPVSIDGDIHFSLLPEVVLTATRVTLADRGDGISADIGTLRLRVALAALMHGRILPSDLVLGQTIVRLPWPLPPDVTAPASTRLPKGFSARLVGGTLQFGNVTLGGVAATLRTDADTGAFAANGTVAGSEQNWRYTALLGAPGADGVSTLNVTADGQDKAQDTGGYFRGRMLPGGAVEGMVSARGPDLSQLIISPATPWQVSGTVSASGLQVGAPALDLSIGSSPGHAALVLSLQQPFGLTGSVSVGQVDIGGWAALTSAASRPELPMHLELYASAGTLRGGVVRNLHGALTLNRNQARVDHAGATLPGGTDIALDGDFTPGGYAGTVDGHTNDLPATLRWAAPHASVFISNLNLPVPHAASLHSDLLIHGGVATFSGLAGTVGGTEISGGLGFGFGQQRTFTIGLTLKNIDLDAIDTISWSDALALTDMGIDGNATIAARTASWHGIHLSSLKLAARSMAAGLTVSDFVADGPGFHVGASGTLGASGSLSAVNVSVNAPDAAALPGAWRVFPGLWQGNFDFAASASGKPGAMATQVRADIGDLRLEGDGTVDFPQEQVEATMTLRHPGAPRLLHGLGVEDAARWLDTGSVALAAHLHAQRGRLDVHDIALSAADLHLGGSAIVDMNGGEPEIDAALHAENLALPTPPFGDTVPVALLSGWHGQATLDADALSLNLIPLAAHIKGSAVLAGGVLALNVAQARHGDAALAGDLAIDASTAEPTIALHGTVHGAPLSGMPAGFTGGSSDLAADLLARGQSWATLVATSSGEINGTFDGVSMAGLDLQALTHLLMSRPARLRTALQTALGAGMTTGLDGAFQARLDRGAAMLRTAEFTSPAGTIDLAGNVDLAEQTLDLQFAVRPAVAMPPVLGLRLVGPWQTPRRVADAAPGVVWAGKTHRP